MRFRARNVLVAGIFAVFAAVSPSLAQQYDQKFFSAMKT